MYPVGERVEDDSDLFSVRFAIADERNREFLFQHLKPRGLILCEVSPFCAVEPLEDQEKQKKVWEIFNNVDGLRFDDALSIDPGDADGSACWKASVHGCPPKNRPTYRPG